METTQALNEQPGHVIERIDEGRPVYFSVKVGRDNAQPAGGWTHDINQADVMTSEAANHLLDHALTSIAPNCKLVPK